MINRTTNNKIYLPLSQQLRYISHYPYLQNSKAIEGEREINIKIKSSRTS